MRALSDDDRFAIVAARRQAAGDLPGGGPRRRVGERDRARAREAERARDRRRDRHRRDVRAGARAPARSRATGDRLRRRRDAHVGRDRRGSARRSPAAVAHRLARAVLHRGLGRRRAARPAAELARAGGGQYVRVDECRRGDRSGASPHLRDQDADHHRSRARPRRRPRSAVLFGERQALARRRARAARAHAPSASSQGRDQGAARFEGLRRRASDRGRRGRRGLPRSSALGGRIFPPPARVGSGAAPRRGARARPRIRSHHAVHEQPRARERGRVRAARRAAKELAASGRAPHVDDALERRRPARGARHRTERGHRGLREELPRERNGRRVASGHRHAGQGRRREHGEGGRRSRRAPALRRRGTGGRRRAVGDDHRGGPIGCPHAGQPGARSTERHRIGAEKRE